jgi:hypothetical protein
MVLCLVIFYQTGFAIGNFSRAVTDFINVTEAKLTRVIIDLQQNTGGTVELAFRLSRDSSQTLILSQVAGVELTKWAASSEKLIQPTLMECHQWTRNTTTLFRASG